MLQQNRGDHDYDDERDQLPSEPFNVCRHCNPVNILAQGFGLQINTLGDLGAGHKGITDTFLDGVPHFRNEDAGMFKLEAWIAVPTAASTSSVAAIIVLMLIIRDQTLALQEMYRDSVPFRPRYLLSSEQQISRIGWFVPDEISNAPNISLVAGVH